MYIDTILPKNHLREWITVLGYGERTRYFERRHIERCIFRTHNFFDREKPHIICNLLKQIYTYNLIVTYIIVHHSNANQRFGDAGVYAILFGETLLSLIIAVLFFYDSWQEKLSNIFYWIVFFFNKYDSEFPSEAKSRI